MASSAAEEREQTSQSGNTSTENQNNQEEISEAQNASQTSNARNDLTSQCALSHVNNSVVLNNSGHTTHICHHGNGASVVDGRPNLRQNHSSNCRFWYFQEHLKNMTSHYGQWTCFLCCHVRIATIAIGFWHLILHLMTLFLIGVLIVHPEIFMKIKKEFDPKDSERLMVTPSIIQEVQAVNCTEMPCLLAAQDDNEYDIASEFPVLIGSLMPSKALNKENINVDLSVTLFTMVMTLLLIYGAIRQQAFHMMPFFFLQVFDFCVTCMSMFGFMSYLPNIRQMIANSRTFPFKQLQQRLLAMDTRCLTFFVMLTFLLTIMVKAYCINIIWRCYKYLLQKGQSVHWPPMRARRNRNRPSEPIDQESQTFFIGQDLPDYNTAIADPKYRKKLPQHLFPEPPPSYDMAMSALFAQHHILSQVQNNNNNSDVVDGGETSAAGETSVGEETRTGEETSVQGAEVNNTVENSEQSVERAQLVSQEENVART